MQYVGLDFPLSGVLTLLYIVVALSYVVIAYALFRLREVCIPREAYILLALVFTLRAVSVLGGMGLPFYPGLSYVVAALQTVSAAITVTAAWKLIELVVSVRPTKRG